MEITERGLSAMENVCVFHRMCLTRRSVFEKMCSVLFICFVLVDLVCSYNLDLETRTVHMGDPKSMFGYSVALHHDQGSYWYTHFFTICNLHVQLHLNASLKRLLYYSNGKLIKKSIKKM